MYNFILFTFKYGDAMGLKYGVIHTTNSMNSFYIP